jgi:NAD(P)-dependent dehydrogenase (short-subunit alcohol dehydrogenase family)
VLAVLVASPKLLEIRCKHDRADAYGGLCRPEEVARVAHFLAADASSYITGQVWSVNGGMDM